jgi:hypothetical protein
MNLNGVPALSLAPADELFHACVHGVRWNRMPPVRWIADAMTIIREAEGMEWSRLVQQATKRRLSLPVHAALSFLRAEFGASVPPEVLDELCSIPVTKAEIAESDARQKRPGWTWQRPPYLWVYYPRIARDTGRQPGLLGFLGYLRALWDLDHRWQVPLYAAWMNVKRLLGVPVGDD